MLKELQKNEKSTKEVKSDTATRYLNLTAYGYFRDIEGRPSIKPPWGTLNAINLNTGEYEWKVPVGNYPDLQEEGKPITGSWGVFSVWSVSGLFYREVKFSGSSYLDLL